MSGQMYFSRLIFILGVVGAIGDGVDARATPATGGVARSQSRTSATVATVKEIEEGIIDGRALVSDPVDDLSEEPIEYSCCVNQLVVMVSVWTQMSIPRATLKVWLRARRTARETEICVIGSATWIPSTICRRSPSTARRVVLVVVVSVRT